MKILLVQSGNLGCGSWDKRPSTRTKRFGSRSLLRLFVLLLVAWTGARAQTNVATAQYDNTRSNANLNETILNTSNVNVSQFGLLYTRSLDGSLYAQPLYVSNVVIPGNGTHNVIYLATLHNTVVAFDADNPSQATPLWQVNLGPSRPCCYGGFMTPEMGIVGTPVIDTSTSTLYVVAATLLNGSYYHWLHALDITTGQEKFGGPVSITATVPGSGYDSVGGLVTFNSGNSLQRAALALVNSTVYVSFASIDDADYWHGWLIGYNAAKIQQQVFVYNDSANGERGGIWQAGRGLVSDSNGYLYFLTGNGDYDGANDFGDSMVKLNSAAAVQDWFTPDDEVTLAEDDGDLGSSGPLLIPNTNPALLVGGGKQGILYLINSTTGSMGKFQPGNTQVQSWQATNGEILNNIAAYWSNPGSPLLYVWGSQDYLKAFEFEGVTFNTTPVAKGSLIGNFPGGVLAVSANGSTANTGVLWATTAGSNSANAIATGTLRAYNAANISSIELYDSTQNAARDTLGNFAKFTSPTVDNGKVYVPTFSNQLDVYGLLGTAGINIWLGPTSLTLPANGVPYQFSATLAGTSNTAVNWTVSPALGTISSNGLYTPPYPGIISSTQTVTITATSQANTTKSATAAVTLTPFTATGTAAFAHLDTATQGNWQGVYGSNGYNVIGGTVAYPSYVTVTPSGQSTDVWTSSTTDVRALYTSATSTTRIAGTWYNSTTFLVDMVFNDGLQHEVAFYFLDWDTTARSETVLIQDADGVQLSPTQTVSSFHNGEYLVYVLSGHVQMRVSDLNPSANVVLSGLFFGTPGVAPTYTFTGPAGGALNTASSNFTVTPNGTYSGTITITPSGGGLSTPIVLTYSSSAAPQTFTITPTAVGPVKLTPSNSGSLTNPSALSYATPPGAPTIGTATAGNGQVAVSFTAPASTGGSAITSYKATCGSQSVSGTASPITVTGLSNGTSYTCTVTASNAEGVGAPSAASNSVTPSVVASSYTLTGPTGGALNTASSNFTVTPNGTYSGTITITPSGGGLSTPIVLTYSNSAASQTFTITPTAVGPVKLTPSNSGSLTNPSALSYATPPGAPTIGTATAGNGQVAVSFTAPASTGGSAITSYKATCGSQSVSGTASPITVTGLSNGTSYTCTVTASNAEGVGAPSAASNSVTPSSTAGTTTGTATFATLDTTTQGNWQGVYGSNGYNVINGTVSYPSFVTVTPSGTGAATWASSTTDVRALYTSATSTTRIAATWYNTTTFLIDLVFNDGNQHQLALYCLDWDTTQRAETVAVQDANGVLLNTQNMTNFHNGDYLVWQLSGHVQILVTTKTSSANAVVSGLFFDPVVSTATSFALTGPTGGALNTASSNFTVTPNGTYSGTITITPSGGGLSTPIVLTYSSSAAPQTFTITPTAVGPVKLTPSNSGSLTNPSALSYATPPGAPTIGTATAGNGQVAVSFTAPASTGGSAITSYKATCGSQSVSGTASPITVTGLSNGTSYTCTVTASNAEGVGAPSAASNSVTPSSTAGTTTGTATFATLDTTTQGNWQGVYGSNGYNVINGTVSYPSFVTVTPSGTGAATWASSTTDVRALYTSATSTTRIAATWYNTTTFLIDLVFNDGNQHQLALYCLDWDTTQRAETVAVQDANGVLLNTQNMTNFHNGDYLVWQLSGHVQILVTTKTSSANAVVSGLFFK